MPPGECRQTAASPNARIGRVDIGTDQHGLAWQPARGPSSNKLGSCNAAPGGAATGADTGKVVAWERRRTPLRRAVARLPGRHEPLDVR